MNYGLISTHFYTKVPLVGQAVKVATTAIGALIEVRAHWKKL